MFNAKMALLRLTMTLAFAISCSAVAMEGTVMAVTGSWPLDERQL